MQFEVKGDVMQCVVAHMQAGEEVRADVGAMIYLSDGVDINTKITGGIMAGLKRAFSGATLFLTHFNCTAPSGMAAFAAHYPGHVRQIDLNGDAWICARDSFLFCTPGIEVGTAFSQQLGFGFFSGEGFVLQSVQGTGTAFLHGGGNLVDYDLAPGQRLRVEAGCAVAFQQSVQYNVEFIGGLSNALFGGEGLFLITLTGPGRVTLSTLPFSRMVGAIMHQATLNTNHGGSGLGGILGN